MARKRELVGLTLEQLRAINLAGYYTVQQAAAHLNCSESKIKDLINSGAVMALRLPSLTKDFIRIPRADFDAYLQANIVVPVRDESIPDNIFGRDRVEYLRWRNLERTLEKYKAA